MIRLGVPVDDADPLAALRDALACAHGDLRAMRQITAEGVELRPDDPRVVMYERTLERAARLAEVASRTRLAERDAHIAAEQAAALHRALDVALDDGDLDPATRARITARLAGALREVSPA